MKLVIVLAVFVAGATAADMFDKLSDQAVRRAAATFDSQLRKRSLRDSERTLILAVRSSFLDAFKDKLDAAKDKIKDLIVNGQSKLKDLLAELKVVLAQLKEATGPAKEKLKQKVQELVQKIKDNSPFNSAKNVIDKVLAILKDDVMNSAIATVTKRYAVDYGFVDTMKDLFNKVTGHFNTFKDWMKEKMTVAWDAAQPVVDILKEMAITFINTALKEASQKIIEEATKFFAEHKDEIGPWLWQQIVEIYTKSRSA